LNELFELSRSKVFDYAQTYIWEASSESPPVAADTSTALRLSIAKRTPKEKVAKTL
jgi:hypothetical protein